MTILLSHKGELSFIQGLSGEACAPGRLSSLLALLYQANWTPFIMAAAKVSTFADIRCPSWIIISVQFG